MNGEREGRRVQEAGDAWSKEAFGFALGYLAARMTPDQQRVAREGLARRGLTDALVREGWPMPTAFRKQAGSAPVREGTQRSE